jgi:hypothetical protein
VEIILHTYRGGQLAELVSDRILIAGKEDGINLVGELYYSGYLAVVLHRKNIADTFFDLKTGIAGEVLQKFSNYRMPVAIVGDFSGFNSKSLADFIFESNKGRSVFFVDSIEVAKQKLFSL